MFVGEQRAPAFAGLIAAAESIEKWWASGVVSGSPATAGSTTTSSAPSRSPVANSAAPKSPADSTQPSGDTASVSTVEGIGVPDAPSFAASGDHPQIAAAGAAYPAVPNAAPTPTRWRGLANPNTPGEIVEPGHPTRNDNWSNTGNWDNGTPGGDTRDLFFGNNYASAGGTGSTTSNNDLAGYLGHKIIFESGAPRPFTITGNGFSLVDYQDQGSPVFPQIENNSRFLQIFNLLSAGRLPQQLEVIRLPQQLEFLDTSANHKAEINPVSGPLLFSASTTISLAGNTQLQIFGGNTVTFNGAISGANSIVINAGTTVNYGATNTYTGDTFVNNGTLQFTTGSASANNSTIRLGNTAVGSGNASLNLISPTGGIGLTNSINPGFAGGTGLYSINSTNYTGINVLVGALIDLSASLSINVTNASQIVGQLSLAHNVSFQGASNRVLTIGGSGNTSISGNLLNVANGSDVLLKTGSGVLTFEGSSDQTVSGNLLKFDLAGGTLVLRNAKNLGNPSGVSYPDKLTFVGGATPSVATLEIDGSFAYGAAAAGAPLVGFAINRQSHGGNGANIDVTPGNTFTLNGAITDTGADSTAGYFIKTDTGTL
ncbi:MAG: hypothetical protein M3Y69_10360, partial [Verrucomicrobiota bacterium]|nr:hypothetical protein [Verrucomicrobiota bacterium]